MKRWEESSHPFVVFYHGAANSLLAELGINPDEIDPEMLADLMGQFVSSHS